MLRFQRFKPFCNGALDPSGSFHDQEVVSLHFHVGPQTPKLLRKLTRARDRDSLVLQALHDQDGQTEFSDTCAVSKTVYED
jgi:hypothetical protein